MSTSRTALLLGWHANAKSAPPVRTLSCTQASGGVGLFVQITVLLLPVKRTKLMLPL